MATYKVEKSGSDYYLNGLKNSRNEPNTLLLYYYPAGDVDAPYDADKMLGALYDTYQYADDLKEGDVFETPFGNFVCRGVHVVPLKVPDAT